MTKRAGLPAQRGTPRPLGRRSRAGRPLPSHSRGTGMEGPMATQGMEAELGGEPKAPGSRCLLPSSAQLPVDNKPLQWVRVGQRRGRAPCAHPRTQVAPWSSTLGHPKSFVMHGQESSGNCPKRSQAFHCPQVQPGLLSTSYGPSCPACHQPSQVPTGGSSPKPARGPQTSPGLPESENMAKHTWESP